MNLSDIKPEQQGYRTFEKKIPLATSISNEQIAPTEIKPKTSIFKNAHEFDLEEMETARILHNPEVVQQPATGTASELTITIRDDERSLKSKHLLYNQYHVNSDDPVIKEIIAKALQEFNGEPTAIRIRISLVVL